MTRVPSGRGYLAQASACNDKISLHHVLEKVRGPPNGRRLPLLDRLDTLSTPRWLHAVCRCRVDGNQQQFSSQPRPAEIVELWRVTGALLHGTAYRSSRAPPALERKFGDLRRASRSISRGRTRLMVLLSRISPTCCSAKPRLLSKTSSRS
jgi:hypothetical protein